LGRILGTMRTSTRTALATAVVSVGALGVAGAITTGIASSAEAPAATAEEGATGPLDRALDGLVEDGTLTQEQADAVREALVDELPPGWARWHHGHEILEAGLETAAEAIGVDVDELREALADGSSIADVAEEHGVEPSAVVDAIVAAGNERIDQAVADGDLTEEQAAALRDRLAEGAERFVNATPPFGGPPPWAGGPGGPFGGPGGPGGPGGFGGPPPWAGGPGGPGGPGDDAEGD
jgi:polyhydroxyalkanoate synthesis regulator phasin